MLKEDSTPLEEISFILSNIEKHYLEKEGSLRNSIIHADPKLQNILFQKGKAIAFIDFDTVMRGSYLIDLGDGLRSLYKINNKFSEELFSACLKGYRSEIEIPHTDDEIKSAIGLFSLELAARYCKNYFDQSYFPWDQDNYPSVKKQNLENARKCIEYYKTILLT